MILSFSCLRLLPTLSFCQSVSWLSVKSDSLTVATLPVCQFASERGYLTCWSRWYRQNRAKTSRSAATSTFDFHRLEEMFFICPHNLLIGGIWPADHDGTIIIASNRPVRSLRVLFDPKSRFYRTPRKSSRGCPRPWTIQCHPLLVAQTRREGVQ